ncbi:MAG: hypothetical protein CMJ18_10675 [Phycisphaeraceae bacterium]|nr:hypothetical protein [Phycisphaeraceae bacterium]
MIELEANISEATWREQFPPAARYFEYFPSEEAFRDASAPLVCQIVTMRHPDLPDCLWHLRLPEKIATDDTPTTGAYQEHIRWIETDEGWHFDDIPIAGLDGRIRGRIASSGDTVDYELTVRNESPDPWPRALAWLCFNHCMALPFYRYRNYIFRDGAAIETRSRVELHFCLAGHDRDWWIRADVDPADPLIATRCEDASGREYALAIAAERAIILGQNPDWPCTDIGLLFGDVAPGDDATVRGRIYFHRGTIKEVYKRYREDFGGG